MGFLQGYTRSRCFSSLCMATIPILVPVPLYSAIVVSPFVSFTKMLLNPSRLGSLFLSRKASYALPSLPRYSTLSSGSMDHDGDGYHTPVIAPVDLLNRPDAHAYFGIISSQRLLLLVLLLLLSVALCSRCRPSSPAICFIMLTVSYNTKSLQ